MQKKKQDSTSQDIKYPTRGKGHTPPCFSPKSRLVSCFTWELFKGSLMVSSSSLTPSELNNPYLETRAKSCLSETASVAVRAKKHVGTIR